jgi:hypothetical protein
VAVPPDVSVIVVVSDAPESGSAIVTLANGVVLAWLRMVCGVALVPPIVGGVSGEPGVTGMGADLLLWKGQKN